MLAGTPGRFGLVFMSVAFQLAQRVDFFAVRRRQLSAPRMTRAPVPITGLACFSGEGWSSRKGEHLFSQTPRLTPQNARAFNGDRGFLIIHRGLVLELLG